VRKDPARGPNCTPENLIKAVSDYGPNSRVPMLWVYSENDKLFNPDLVQKLHAAYVKNGGKAELEFVKPFRNDGHDIFRKSGSHVLWGPPLEKFLKSYVK
jgi:dienelactone hydrolase